MDCHEAQLVMALYIIDHPSLTAEEREGFEAHLHVCPECAKDYKESSFAIAFFRRYWTTSNDIRQFQEKKGINVKPKKRFMTVEEGWEDLKRRVPELARLDVKRKQRNRIRRIVKIAAIAASILLIFSLSWKYFSSQSSTSAMILSVVTFNPTAELIEDNQLKPISFGKPIVTQNHKQEIRLGRMHRLVMNAASQVTIRADQLSGKTRYNLELAKGELYIEVVPGNPFTVQTPNAHLIITGTMFNVKYDENKTDLTLVKGSIHFGNSKDEWTDVTAGCSSSVLADASPTTPEATDVSKQIAWTKETTESTAKRLKDMDSIDININESLIHRLPSLNSLRYDSWVNNKRDYFAQRFPWIFNAEEILKNHGIETDYVTLLVISGDIWQFNYHRSSKEPIPVFNPISFKRITKFYQIDPAVLKKIILQTKDEPQNYKEALKLWQQDIQQVTNQSNMPFDLLAFTLHATEYLNDTYTDVYLWIDAHSELAQRLLTDTQYVEAYSLVFPNDRTMESWQKKMVESVSAIQDANLTTQGLFFGVDSSDCSRYSQEMVHKLQKEISLLIPNEMTTGGNCQ